MDNRFKTAIMYEYDESYYFADYLYCQIPIEIVGTTQRKDPLNLSTLENFEEKQVEQLKLRRIHNLDFVPDVIVASTYKENSSQCVFKLQTAEFVNPFHVLFLTNLGMYILDDPDSDSTVTIKDVLQTKYVNRQFGYVSRQMIIDQNTFKEAIVIQLPIPVSQQTYLKGKQFIILQEMPVSHRQMVAQRYIKVNTMSNDDELNELAIVSFDLSVQDRLYASPLFTYNHNKYDNLSLYLNLQTNEKYTFPQLKSVIFLEFNGRYERRYILVNSDEKDQKGTFPILLLFLQGFIQQRPVNIQKITEKQIKAVFILFDLLENKRFNDFSRFMEQQLKKFIESLGIKFQQNIYPLGLDNALELLKKSSRSEKFELQESINNKDYFKDIITPLIQNPRIFIVDSEIPTFKEAIENILKDDISKLYTEFWIESFDEIVASPSVKYDACIAVERQDNIIHVKIPLLDPIELEIKTLDLNYILMQLAHAITNRINVSHYTLQLAYTGGIGNDILSIRASILQYFIQRIRSYDFAHMKEKQIQLEKQPQSYSIHSLFYNFSLDQIQNLIMNEMELNQIESNFYLYLNQLETLSETYRYEYQECFVLAQHKNMQPFEKEDYMDQIQLQIIQLMIMDFSKLFVNPFTYKKHTAILKYMKKIEKDNDITSNDPIYTDDVVLSEDKNICDYIKETDSYILRFFQKHVKQLHTTCIYNLHHYMPQLYNQQYFLNKLTKFTKYAHFQQHYLSLVLLIQAAIAEFINDDTIIKDQLFIQYQNITTKENIYKSLFDEGIIYFMKELYYPTSEINKIVYCLKGESQFDDFKYYMSGQQFLYMFKDDSEEKIYYENQAEKLVKNPFEIELNEDEFPTIESGIIDDTKIREKIQEQVIENLKISKSNLNQNQKITINVKFPKNIIFSPLTKDYLQKQLQQHINKIIYDEDIWEKIENTADKYKSEHQHFEVPMYEKQIKIQPLLSVQVRGEEPTDVQQVEDEQIPKYYKDLIEFFREDYNQKLRTIDVEYNLDIQGKPYIKVSYEFKTLKNKEIKLIPMTPYLWGCCDFIQEDEQWLYINCVVDVVRVEAVKDGFYKTTAGPKIDLKSVDDLNYYRYDSKTENIYFNMYAQVKVQGYKQEFINLTTKTIFQDDNDLAQNYAMLWALFISYNAQSFGFDSKLNGSYNLILYTYCYIRTEYENKGILSDYIQEFYKYFPSDNKVQVIEPENDDSKTFEYIDFEIVEALKQKRTDPGKDTFPHSMKYQRKEAIRNILTNFEQVKQFNELFTTDMAYFNLNTYDSQAEAISMLCLCYLLNYGTQEQVHTLANKVFSSEPGLDMLFVYMSKIMNKQIKKYIDKKFTESPEFKEFTQKIQSYYFDEEDEEFNMFYQSQINFPYAGKILYELDTLQELPVFNSKLYKQDNMLQGSGLQIFWIPEQTVKIEETRNEGPILEDYPGTDYEFVYCVSVENEAEYKLFDKRVAGETVERVLVLAYRKVTEMPAPYIPLIQYNHTAMKKNNLNIVETSQIIPDLQAVVNWSIANGYAQVYTYGLIQKIENAVQIQYSLLDFDYTNDVSYRTQYIKNAMERDYADNSLILINSIQRHMNEKSNKSKQLERKRYVEILYEFLQNCHVSSNSDAQELQILMKNYQATDEYKKNDMLYNDIFNEIQKMLIYNPVNRLIDHSTRTYLYID